MFLLYGGGSGSPIEARQTAPIFLIILILLIIMKAVYIWYKKLTASVLSKV